MRKLCITYMAVLTAVLLLVGNPLKFVSGQSSIVALYRFVEPALHVVLFAVLAMAVLTVLRSQRYVYIAGLLVAYAAASELVQLFLPGRAARVDCFVQDLIGLAAGASLWWLLGNIDLVHSRRFTSGGRHRPAQCLEARPVTLSEIIVHQRAIGAARVADPGVERRR